MRQLFSADDCNGKTIAPDGFHLGSNGPSALMIRFADDSFIIIGNECADYEDYYVLRISTCAAPDWDLVTLGLMTPEERSRRQAEAAKIYAAKDKAIQEERERAEYARLKAKFERGNRE